MLCAAAGEKAGPALDHHGLALDRREFCDPGYKPRAPALALPVGGDGHGGERQPAFGRGEAGEGEVSGEPRAPRQHHFQLYLPCGAQGADQGGLGRAGKGGFEERFGHFFFASA